MNATVVITTKNRKEDLRTAVQSAVEQSAKPEVLVVDDGSDDGTSEMIRSEFPQVRIDRRDPSQGYIVQRNRGAHLATGEIIFSIDDDAIFSTPYVVEQTLAEFTHPRIGAIAIPFINVKKENILWQRAPEGDGIFCTSEYIGTAHALRRELFLQLHGYREYLFHQGEERDYCIRMIDAGRVVRLGKADPIHHFESPRRDFRRQDLFGRRNDVLYAWHNVPMPKLPLHLLATTALGAKFGFGCGRPLRMLHGLLNGYGAIVHEISNRKPVSRQAYRISRMLKKQPYLLTEIEPTLPAMV